MSEGAFCLPRPYTPHWTEEGIENARKKKGVSYQTYTAAPLSLFSWGRRKGNKLPGPARHDDLPTHPDFHVFLGQKVKEAPVVYILPRIVRLVPSLLATRVKGYWLMEFSSSSPSPFPSSYSVFQIQIVQAMRLALLYALEITQPTLTPIKSNPS